MMILVTGAASGIGRHLVARLAGAGHHVLATDVRADALQDVAISDGWPGGRVRWCRLDVTEAKDWSEAIEQAVAWRSRIDVVMNVAGYLKPSWIEGLDASDINRHLSVNIKGVMLGTSAAARVMAAQSPEKKTRGHIVNIASLAGLAPIPGISVYSASKFAVRGFTLAAAEELREKGIAVSCVLPDAVETPMLDLQADYEEAEMTFSGSRSLSVDEVANVIIDRVLPRRPLEVTIPLDRGVAARFGGAVPGAARWIFPLLKRKGRARQKGYKGGTGG